MAWFVWKDGWMKRMGVPCDGPVRVPDPLPMPRPYEPGAVSELLVSFTTHYPTRWVIPWEGPIPIGRRVRKPMGSYTEEDWKSFRRGGDPYLDDRRYCTLYMENPPK